MTNQTTPTPPARYTNSDVVAAGRERLIGMLRKQDPPAKAKAIPRNKSYLALWGFNGAMLFLDLISGWTVAILSQAAYGVATVVAGVLALLLHEKLFQNPHANESQKLIAIGGGVIAVASTLLVGLGAAVLNIFSIDSIIGGKSIEVVMVGFLIVSIFAHGILWGWYYFTDPQHVAEMKRMVHIAFRQQTREGIEEAKEDVREVIEMDRVLQQYDNAGLLDVLTVAFQEARGRSLISTPSTTPLDPAMQIALNTLLPANVVPGSPAAPAPAAPAPAAAANSGPANITLQTLPANTPTPVTPAPVMNNGTTQAAPTTVPTTAPTTAPSGNGSGDPGNSPIQPTA